VTIQVFRRGAKGVSCAREVLIREEGTGMESKIKIVMVLAAVLLIASSCAMISHKLGLRAEGEMRLVRVAVPGVMKKDLPYKAEVTFEADGQPEIKSVCFRWLSVIAPVRSPSLYCYTQEVEANQPIGAVCSRVEDGGIYRSISALSCSKPQNIRYGMPGSFTVMLEPGDVRPEYNAVECSVEYVQDGEVKQTNKVRANVIVDYRD
jgi:hypothetical protein